MANETIMNQQPKKRAIIKILEFHSKKNKTLKFPRDSSKGFVTFKFQATLGGAKLSPQLCALLTSFDDRPRMP